MPDSEFRESRGNKTHRSDCRCPPCVQQRDYARKLAEQAALVAGYQVQHRAAMRVVAAAAARLTGLPAPDALRVLAGPGDALAVLEGAGMDAGEVAGRWLPADVPRQASTSLGDWGPDHDPRVTHALTHGASDAELAGIRQQVAQEYQQRAVQKAQREAAYYGRDQMPVALGVSTGPGGAPQQTSSVHTDVPELGSERW